MRQVAGTSGPPESSAGPSSCAESVTAAAVSVGRARVSSLGAEAALSVALAARHAAAAALAVELEALARLVSTYPDAEALGGLDEDSAVVFEVMAALGVSQRSAANRLSIAGQLSELPALCAALRDGVLDASTGYLVLERVRVLPAPLQVEAVDRLLAAHDQLPGGLTRWQLTRLLSRIVATLDPRGAEQRQGDAVRDRRVWHHGHTAAGEEASLGMTGPAERVALCADTIDALARAILDHARRFKADAVNADAGSGEAGPVCPPSATLEQARFDALDWLITGRAADSHPAWAAMPDRDHPAGDRVEHGDPSSAPERRRDAAAPEDELPPWETCADHDGEAGGVSVGDEPAGSIPGDAPTGGVPRDGPTETAHTDGPAGIPDDVPVEGASGDGSTRGAGRCSGPGAAWPGQPGVFSRPAAGLAIGTDDAIECGCGRPRVSVVAQVTLSLATLLGLDDAPGELAGHGTIPASVARDLAASATVWKRLLTDPVDSHLITQEIKSYRPSAAMRAYVHARTGGVCASRGCTARRNLQIDHDTPHPRGPTSVTNTALLHQPHHQGKTCGAWCHHLHPDTGWLTQTSPLGRTYTTVPLPPLGGDLDGSGVHGVGEQTAPPSGPRPRGSGAGPRAGCPQPRRDARPGRRTVACPRPRGRPSRSRGRPTRWPGPEREHEAGDEGAPVPGSSSWPGSVPWPDLPAVWRSRSRPGGTPRPGSVRPEAGQARPKRSRARSLLVTSRAATL